MEKRIFIAGFGGQGVMLLAKMIGKAVAHEGTDCTFFPEYETSVRNGASFATIVVSDTAVESCVVPKFDYMAVMDNRSFEEQIHRVVPGGYLLVNTSLIKAECPRSDINVISVPMNDLAEALGNEKLANTIMAGAIWQATMVTKKESILQEIRNTFSSKEKLIAVNIEAFEKGAEVVAQQMK